ncbi:uncharacterized protein Z519_02561 [Cladophialophora bantiana CBS 173.52]|uniref:N-acetyltransferase domain-containing protein n=1 Tax=Cladophialophora bantiana (strain ATCC 10958 / CBS 173.52 / CDC B-1940 / NIH 8579) TaxID=1442370 RepID=A0A0D2IK30_CLAB1|nr:uncharacterized protein Z519_02561 [Cladophialophora bantiana CBS 173.52]KIW97169.1 hypothetical protein Z519_02561 [Cladophialophora bantiana CBS 173.52]
MGHRHNSSCPTAPVFHNLRRLPRSIAPRILHEMRSLEGKVFASHEIFPFDEKVLKQRNMEVIVGLSDRAGCSTVVAYAVVVKWNHRLLLHKICVSPAARGHGIGSLLVQKVIEDSKCWSCRAIELWVDEANHIARGLYSKYGFVVEHTVPDYYSPGRNGLKMVQNFQP